MSRKQGDDCTFKQRDLKAAIRAARDAGLESFRVDVGKDGTISVVPTTAPGEPGPSKEANNEWDDDL
jgi:hypothetical protein